MTGKVFYSVIVGFSLGIFISSFIKLGFSAFVLTTTISVVVLFLSIRGIFFQKRKVFLASIFILFFGIGILRFSVGEIKQDRLKAELISVLGQKINITGVVDSESVQSGVNQRVVVKIKTNDWNIKGKEFKLEHKILVQTPANPKLLYGDQIAVLGKIELPDQIILDETGRQFDYGSYLANDNIFYQISFAQVKIVAQNRGNFLQAFLYNIKNGFMNNIKRVIGEPQVSYLGGLLLGDKTSLPTEWKEIFAKAGITHIVALSGYNITIIAEWLGKFFSLFLSLAWSLSLGGLGIVLFVLMTGASATAVRSGIMALIVILGRTTGRQYDIKRSLFSAGLIMIAIEPRLLVFDISFQLSFLATLSLIYISPIIEKHFYWAPVKFEIRQLLIATVSAQILVLPLILYKMGWLSFVSVFANLLILPFIPITMLFGFITGMFGYVSQLVSLLPGFITDILLLYQLKIAQVLAWLPGSAVRLDAFSWWWSVLLYVFIFSWLHRNYKK